MSKPKKEPYAVSQYALASMIDAMLTSSYKAHSYWQVNLKGLLNATLHNRKEATFPTRVPNTHCE